MKKILLLGVCLLCGTAMAQDLFPELAGLGKGRVATPVQPAPAVAPVQTTTEEELPAIPGTDSELATEQTEEVVTETTTGGSDDLFAEKTTEETMPAEDEAKPAEEEEPEDNDASQITIYSDNVDATIVPNRNFSYCFGNIKFQNGLRRPINRLSISLTYGALTTDFTVRNIPPKETKTEQLTLVGDACEQIMGMPTMEVTKCEVPDMEEKRCKQRVVFVPLR